jgi:hypothetical protein
MAMDLVMVLGVVTGQQMALETDREQGTVYELFLLWMLIWLLGVVVVMDVMVMEPVTGQPMALETDREQGTVFLTVDSCCILDYQILREEWKGPFFAFLLSRWIKGILKQWVS